MIYLSGPFADLLTFTLCAFLGERLITLGLINLITAISNLLPIRGYDGYGAIITMLKKRELPHSALKLISGLSSALIFTFCVFSLYLIDRYAGGYWIFAVFFVSMIKEIDVGLKEAF